MRSAGFGFHRCGTGSTAFSVACLLIGSAMMASCAGEGPDVQPMSLAIIFAEQLGSNPTDKLPDEIVNLALPLTPACSQAVFVPDVHLVRVDLEEPAVVLLRPRETLLYRLQKDFQAPGAVSIERTVRRYLSNQEIGVSFSRPGLQADAAVERLAEYMEAIGTQNFIVYHPNDTRTSITLGAWELSVQGDAASLRDEITEELCTLSRKGLPISFNVIYSLREGEAPDHPEPLPTELPPPDEVYAMLIENLYQRKNRPEANDLTYREWREAEMQFPHDYRFTVQRAKLAIYGRQTHHEAFNLLNIAAEKAIRNGRADDLLRQLKDEERSTFIKLAMGHAEWHHLIEALEREDESELHPEGH